MHPYLKRCLDIVTSLFSNNDPEENLNEFELLSLQWEQADLDKINNVFSSDMSILQVSVRKKNIHEYQNYLDMLVEHFQKDVAIKPILMDSATETVYLRDFFISQKGFYLDPCFEFITLQEKVITFLRLYSKACSVSDPSFDTSKNLYLTSTFLGELKQLIEVL